MRTAQLLELYSRVKHYLHNSYWMVGEKLLALALNFAATILVARHLGPADFGALSYAISLVALFAIAGHMGLAGLVVREIVNEPVSSAEILGTSASLKFMGMVIGYSALVLYAAGFEGVGSTSFSLILIAGIALLFRPADVVGFWFHAFVQARYPAIAQAIANIVATAIKIGLIFTTAGVAYFALAHLLQTAVAALLLLAFFQAHSGLRFTDWRFNRRRAVSLLGQGAIIYLGSFFAVIYLKVDQVMLRWMIDVQAVGQYAIAAQFSEAWYFVPTAIVSSFFPTLIKARQQNEMLFYVRLQQLFDALFVVAVIVAVVVSLIAPWLIEVFLGPAYAPSAAIVVIHIWASIFIFMRAVVSKWILIENALYFSLLTQGLGACTNVIMNFILIPHYGGQGAAYATLFSYSIASFVALYFHRRTRRVFWLMARAFLAPIRYPLRIATAH